MQIKTKAVNDTAFLHLRDAAGEMMFEGDKRDDESRVGVTLFGPGSHPFQEAKARHDNRNVDRLKGRGKADVSSHERLTDTAEFLAAITSSFQHVEMDGLDKKPLTGNDLALGVYSDPTLGFITNQVNSWAGDWANFTTK